MKSYIVLVALILFGFCDSQEWRTGRHIGGNTVNGRSETYNCPCGCNVTSIQGQNVTQIIGPDERCGSPSPPDAIIVDKKVACPCGCKLTTKHQTTVIFESSDQCKNDSVSRIGNIMLSCLCSCSGYAHDLFYEIKKSIHCPLKDSHEESTTSVTGKLNNITISNTSLSNEFTTEESLLPTNATTIVYVKKEQINQIIFEEQKPNSLVGSENQHNLVIVPEENQVQLVSENNELRKDEISSASTILLTAENTTNGNVNQNLV